jgi:hypothetical protein
MMTRPSKRLRANGIGEARRRPKEGGSADYFAFVPARFISGSVMSLRLRTRPGLTFVEQCLPSPAKAPPSGPNWIHESSTTASF